MKRLLWLGIGLAVGVIVVRRATRVAQQFTPGGIASQVSASAGGLVQNVRDFVDDVRDAMAEREQEIREAFDNGVLFDDEFAELRADDEHGTGYRR